MKKVLATLFLLGALSPAAMAQWAPGQGYGPPHEQLPTGPPNQQPPGPPDFRRGGDQIGPYSAISDLLRANYRVVGAYQGGLIVVRDERVFVCSYVQVRDGGGGMRLLSQGCNEIREPRGPR